MKQYAIVGLFLLSIPLHSQGPGGVTSGLRGWYKGNAGVTLVTGVVSQWNDNSGNGFNATQTSTASRPSPNTTGFNYNSTISFDGVDNYFNMSDLVSSTSTAITTFAVARQTATNRDTYGCILVGQTNNIGSGGGYGLTASNSGNTAFGFFVRDYFNNFGSAAGTLTVPTIMCGNWNGTTANNIEYSENAASLDTDPYTPGSVGDNGNSYIGSGIGSGTDYCFYGDIAEVIVYNVGLNAASTSAVHSYLALKYGITKSGSYVNSAATNIFNNTAPYNRNVIALARDDNSALMQKQSRNYDDSVRIYISTLAASSAANTGTFSSNNQYVVMGSNSGKLVGMATERPAGIYSRLEREWEVENTGFGSTFNINVKLPTAALPASVTASDIRLLVDADGNFTNSAVYSAFDGLTISYSNSVITISGITTTMIPSNSTRYITIGSSSPNTPLPIQLISFDAVACDDNICLHWETFREWDNDYFEILRSNWKGEDFEYVTRADATSGLMLRINKYYYTDKDLKEGLYYYKLKQIDFDGTSTISKPIVVNLNSRKERIILFPNPASNSFLIKTDFPLVSSDVTLTLVDALGRKFHIAGISGDENSINYQVPAELQKGWYFGFVNSAPQLGLFKLMLDR